MRLRPGTEEIEGEPEDRASEERRLEGKEDWRGGEGT